MAKFFISYRRTDTSQIVGSIHDKLSSYFGEDAVFVDVEDIQPGKDFRSYTEEILSKCDALLTLIGPRWIACFQDKKLAEDEDYVRIEIEIALFHAIPILPILIGQTRMPRPEELPATISQFALRNAIQLDTGRKFRADIKQLIGHLESVRIGKSLDSHQQTFDDRLVQYIGESVVEFLRQKWEDDIIFFKVFGSNDFYLKSNLPGVSFFLHKIIQDSTSLIELHFILTAWSEDVLYQHRMVGWLIDQIRRHPVLPMNSELSKIAPGIMLHVFPSMEDARTIWRAVTKEPYQISISYILRASYT